MHEYLTSGPRGLNFGLSLLLLLYFVHARSEGSGETVQIVQICPEPSLLTYAMPRSTVRKVSGYRCESDCRSRDREFDPSLFPSFVEIDHEIISTIINLPSAEGCCQLQAKVCAGSTG